MESIQYCRKRQAPPPVHARLAENWRSPSPLGWRVLAEYFHAARLTIAKPRFCAHTSARFWLIDVGNPEAASHSHVSVFFRSLALALANGQASCAIPPFPDCPPPSLSRLFRLIPSSFFLPYNCSSGAHKQNYITGVVGEEVGTEVGKEARSRLQLSVQNLHNTLCGKGSFWPSFILKLFLQRSVRSSLPPPALPISGFSLLERHVCMRAYRHGCGAAQNCSRMADIDVLDLDREGATTCTNPSAQIIGRVASLNNTSVTSVLNALPATPAGRAWFKQMRGVRLIRTPIPRPCRAVGSHNVPALRNLPRLRCNEEPLDAPNRTAS